MRRIAFLLALLLPFGANADVCFPGPCPRATSDFAGTSVTSAKLADTMCSDIISVFINPTEARGTEDFVNLIDRTISDTDAAEDAYLVPANSVVHSLRVVVDAVPGAGDRWDITVMNDGAATSLTCDISGASATTCNDLVNSHDVAALSDMTVLVSSAAGTTAPALTGEAIISFCITPD